MPELKYKPIPYDHKAFLAKASKRKGFTEAYKHRSRNMRRRLTSATPCFARPVVKFRRVNAMIWVVAFSRSASPTTTIARSSFPRDAGTGFMSICLRLKIAAVSTTKR